MINISKVVFKLRINNPNKKNTPLRHENNINYIATRPGVVLNEAGKHGLFGNVEGFSNDINDLKELKQHVKQKSKEKTIMYRGIISLKEEDALRLGYDDKKIWEEYLKNNISSISSELGIKAENTQWVAAFHMERGHPHIHFMLWDKNQEIKKAFVPWQIADKIRVNLTKSIFENDFDLLFKQKENAKEVVKSSGFFEDFDNILSDMSYKEFERLKTKLISSSKDLALGKIPYTKYTYEQLSIVEDLFELKKVLPIKGRLSYSFMTPEIKKEINKVALKILEKNKDCSSAFNDYIKSCLEIATMYTNDENKLDGTRHKAYKEIEKIIGNSILNSVREIIGKEHEIIENGLKCKLMMDLYYEIFSILTKSIEQKQACLKGLHSGEISKQAKKELAIKLQSKSIDWER